MEDLRNKFLPIGTRVRFEENGTIYTLVRDHQVGETNVRVTRVGWNENLLGGIGDMRLVRTKFNKKGRADGQE